MLKIRLKRCGRKKSPSYRIVLIPSQSKRDGRAIEELGYYNPLRNLLVYNKERIQLHLSQGAQPSQTVRNFLIKLGIIENIKKIQ
uniref:Small ribosomal subunit protein bS16c n=2 Tax=unclassified Vischeria TaxID=2646287 RepID=A0A1D8RDX8_9STRA|nr:ribosomal protein S16 [Vischeria sp. ACOI 3415]YP_010451146.1 ribosomal protein S16 [Vischeria punctata]AOW70920.1 ribosomal protein S16 [Vischeria sp. CAUP Q 202]QAA12168.1 ribosomal protein S16 [Vischeria sp. ACOI 3415]UTV00927.1 ribosomal protein S16 [Vischeria punctata]